MEMDLILQEIPRWQFIALAAIFGALWGSFANVVIVRWPLEQSVLRPGSHCMTCNQKVRFYDNIPILSYFILRGRCRFCKTPFSPKYAVVELAMALLSIGVMNTTLLADPPSFLLGLSTYFVWFAFIWALLTAGMIDLDTFLLPDVITLPGIAVGIAANIFLFSAGWIDPLTSALGSYAGLSLLFVHGYKRLTGRQGMGEGDPKLLAMIGAFLLLKGALFALFAGALQGLVVGTIIVICRRRTRSGPTPPVLEGEPDQEEDDETDDDETSKTPFRWAKVPFGPFLALGAIEYYFFGDVLLSAYTGFVSSLVLGLL
jgi:leader peptidase (prepilin peptidase) / N-methyltransferase